MCMCGCLVRGYLRYKKRRPVLGGVGGCSTGSPGRTTGAIPVTYLNVFKRLDMSGAKRVPNQQRYSKFKTKAWGGASRARPLSHNVTTTQVQPYPGYLDDLGYPALSANISPPAQVNVICPELCLSSALSLMPSGCICLMCLSL